MTRHHRLFAILVRHRVQRDLDAELARSMRKLQQQVPGVKIERREERAPGAYRYMLRLSNCIAALHIQCVSGLVLEVCVHQMSSDVLSSSMCQLASTDT